MRLTDRERNEIVELAKRMFGAGAVVRLFGSRTDDDRIGGDVDLRSTASRSCVSSKVGNPATFISKLLP
jgi:hypothetical protein